MVNPTCYPPAEVRRYNNRVGAYTSYPDRRGNMYAAHPDSRTTTMSSREAADDVTPQRKRIAVACGRCRKRKIRCSGDTGNGGPCTNCKNAGYEPCQFLRVASQETHLKNESFSYSLEASRQYQARGSSIVTPQSSYDGLALQTTDQMGYRAGSAFAYNTKPYYSLSAWTQSYAEEQPVNYAMYQASYPSVQESEYGINYRIGTTGAGKSSAMCVDTEPSYAYTSGPSTGSLAHRSAPGTVGSNGLFQSLTAGLSMGDGKYESKYLPTQESRPLVESPYRNDSGSSIYSKSSQASTSGTSPASTVSDNASGYTSYDTSGMPSIVPACTMSSYPPMTLASQLTRSNDLYSPGGSSDAAALFPGATTSRAGPDMTYHYTDTTTPATTVAATTTARRGSPHTSGSLAMGHSDTDAYVPHGHGHPVSYMLPNDVGGAGTDVVTESKMAGTLRA